MISQQCFTSQTNSRPSAIWKWISTVKFLIRLGTRNLKWIRIFELRLTYITEIAILPEQTNTHIRHTHSHTHTHTHTHCLTAIFQAQKTLVSWFRLIHIQNVMRHTVFPCQMPFLSPCQLHQSTRTNHGKIQSDSIPNLLYLHSALYITFCKTYKISHHNRLQSHVPKCFYRDVPDSNFKNLARAKFGWNYILQSDGLDLDQITVLTYHWFSIIGLYHLTHSTKIILPLKVHQTVKSLKWQQ